MIIENMNNPEKYLVLLRECQIPYLKQNKKEDFYEYQ